MKTVGSGVEPRVESDRAGGETLRETLAIGDIGDEAAPGEIREDVLGSMGGAHRGACTIPSPPRADKGKWSATTAGGAREGGSATRGFRPAPHAPCERGRRGQMAFPKNAPD